MFPNIILYDFEDERISYCLNFISNDVNLIKETISNIDRTERKDIINKLNLSGNLSVNIVSNRITIDFNIKKEIGISYLRNISTKNREYKLFLQIQFLLREIRKLKKEIRKWPLVVDKEISLNNIITNEKQIELLFEQVQRDFVEKQTEQSQRVKHLLNILKESGVEIVPYTERKEISLRVHHFLDEIDKGIFLHLYVPNGRYHEDQLASFLRLFESYLQHVEKLQFFIDTRRTLHGQIYEFKSKNTIINSSDMEVAFSRFDSFMSLCQNDQKKAEALLLRTGMNPSETSRLMTKYVKEHQRLLLDIEHERERKMLDLRQKLESEAFELTHDTSVAVSQSVQPTALLSLPNILDPLSITIANSSVIINSDIQSYVEQAIYGDIHYNTEDKELLNLFERYAERLESVVLRSELEQLKDTSSSEAERNTAKQKIAGFLSKVAPAIGQSALTVLTAYLEKVLTGS